MKITADIARVLLSTITCGLLSALAYYSIEYDGVIFITPFTFILALTLTNIDRVKINKLKAIGLGMMLSLAVFFISLLSTIGLTQIVGQSSIVIMCSVAAVLMYLVCSIYIDMRSFKTGLVTTALLALLAALLTQQLNLYLLNQAPVLAIDPEMFFISWQLLAGLGINIGIWVSVKEEYLTLTRPNKN
ncbi:hypothetical protein [Pontibacter populi]|uniref:DUF4203 domain-containing protein n=1 Tax=Pontibacter populi TaxID=890055 RepID=A0ABV1RPJ4_9BACT